MATEAPTPGRSLSFRLVVLAAGWTTGALLAAAFLLSSLFEDAILRNFDSRLVDQLDELLVAIEVGPGASYMAAPKPLSTCGATRSSSHSERDLSTDFQTLLSSSRSLTCQ